MSVQLVLLHALPLDRSMWRGQMDILPHATLAPDLYDLGDTVTAWAEQILAQARGDRLVVAGCSVGGSCALEIAAAAPHRVAALVLIGTKAAHRPEPALHAEALQTIGVRGLEAAWTRYWEPLFSPATSSDRIAEARRIALARSPADIAKGVTAFHTRAGRESVVADFGGPIVWITGADDPAPGPAATRHQAQRARCGQLHVVPSCGHYVPIEEPDVINTILRDLLTDLSPRLTPPGSSPPPSPRS